VRFILNILVLLLGCSLTLAAETVPVYRIEYGTYSGGNVKYYGANTWHNNVLIVSGSLMKELNYMGSKPPKANEPYKLYNGNQYWQVIITVNPPQTNFKSITQYHPVNKAGGKEKYLKQAHDYKLKFVEGLHPVTNGKSATVAGFACTGYSGKAKDGDLFELYFSTDEKLFSMLNEIRTNTSGLANSFIMGAFFRHPEYGFLMKYHTIEDPESGGGMNKVSQFQFTKIKADVAEKEIFSLDGFKQMK